MTWTQTDADNKKIDTDVTASEKRLQKKRKQGPEGGEINKIKLSSHRTKESKRTNKQASKQANTQQTNRIRRIEQQQGSAGN